MKIILYQFIVMAAYLFQTVINREIEIFGNLFSDLKPSKQDLSRNKDKTIFNCLPLRLFAMDNAFRLALLNYVDEHNFVTDKQILVFAYFFSF